MAPLTSQASSLVFPGNEMRLLVHDDNVSASLAHLPRHLQVNQGRRKKIAVQTCHEAVRLLLPPALSCCFCVPVIRVCFFVRKNQCFPDCVVNCMRVLCVFISVVRGL